MPANQPLTLALGHGALHRSLPAAPCEHEWSRVPDSLSFFTCPLCETQGVCPGCLNSLNVALVAHAAGLSVVWCQDGHTAQEVH